MLLGWSVLVESMKRPTLHVAAAFKFGTQAKSCDSRTVLHKLGVNGV